MIFRSIFFCVLKNKISWKITWKSGVKLRLIITDTVESSKNFGIAERASVVEKLFRIKTRKISAFRKLLYHVLWYIPKGRSSIHFEKFPLNGNCSLSVYSPGFSLQVATLLSLLELLTKVFEGVLKISENLQELRGSHRRCSVRTPVLKNIFERLVYWDVLLGNVQRF